MPILYLGQNKFHLFLVPQPVIPALDPPERARLYKREKEKTACAQHSKCWVWETRWGLGESLIRHLSGSSDSGYDGICPGMKYGMCASKQVRKIIFINLVESLRVQRAHGPNLSKTCYPTPHTPKSQSSSGQLTEIGCSAWVCHTICQGWEVLLPG